MAKTLKKAAKKVAPKKTAPKPPAQKKEKVISADKIQEMIDLAVSDALLTEKLPATDKKQKQLSEAHHDSVEEAHREYCKLHKLPFKYQR